MKKSVYVLVLLNILVLFTSIGVHAQFPQLSYATVTATASPSIDHSGGSAKIALAIAVKSGFHINSVKPNDPDLIPTVVSVPAVRGLSFASPTFPPAKTINAPSLSQKPLSVYTGRVLVHIPVTVSKSARSGVYKIPVSVSYQGCNASACYPPTSTTVTATITVN